MRMKLQWMYKSNTAPCRVNHAAVTVRDTIFSFGGYDTLMTSSSFNESIEVFAFNTITYKWSELKIDSKDAPFRRYGHSVVAFKDKIYLWGGCNELHYDSTLYCFDTYKFTWSIPMVKGDIPDATDGHACCIYKNQMYIHGGFVQFTEEFSNDLHCFNFEDSLWTLLPRNGDSPLFRDFHTISAHPDGHILLYGGREMSQPENRNMNHETYPETLHIYDIQNMTWSVLASGSVRPDGRRSHSAFVIGSSLWIFGGYNNKRGQHYNDFCSYNFGSDGVQGWTMHQVVGQAPQPRRRQAICTLNDNTVFMFGGTHPNPKKKTTPSSPFFDDDTNQRALVELGDLWILDIRPSLSNMCLFYLVNSGRDVPAIFHNRLNCMPKEASKETSPVLLRRISDPHGNH